MTPYDEGYAAYKAGKSLEENPYPKESGMHGDWKRGWDHAWCDDDSVM